MGGVVGGARFRMDVNGSMAKRWMDSGMSKGSGKYRGGEEAPGESQHGGSGNQNGGRLDE